MLGIVLCGGMSSRMGRDKGLFPSDNSNWAGKMLENFEKAGLPCAVSVNKFQVDIYQNAFPGVELICDHDSLQIKGPLAAVLSVHMENPSEDLFIVACDMPMMNRVVLVDLLNHFKNVSGYDAYVYMNDGEPEPLCGIYSSDSLAKIRNMYDQGKLSRHSMKFMLDHLKVLRIPLPETWKIYFRNINAHADLNGM
jgi:molybdopterin-guanine dinucleotide biosynthesis protein A